jgi:hypothetical protein
VDPTALDAADYVLTTDRTSYIADGEGEGPNRQYRFTVQATFTNRGPSDVYLDRCSPSDDLPRFSVGLAAPDGEGRMSAFSPNWACAGHDRQIRVPAGASRTYSLVIYGPTAVDGVTKAPLGVFAASKRLAFWVQACRGVAECGISGAGVSAPFTVSVAP